MIGLGIVTFNRPDYFKKNLHSLIENDFGGANKVFVVDDCSDEVYVSTYNKLFDLAKEHGVIIIKNEDNKGVGISKNTLLKQMMRAGCNHLFLMEDDILMKSSLTCKSYIDYARKHGLEHMNFALHGEMNKVKPIIYKDMPVYPNCVGAFSYYTRKIIDKVGFIDENFKNAWEHVEHTYRIVEVGGTTPFWKFVDHPSNSLLLEEIPGSINNSSIRPLVDWQKNIGEGQRYWLKKHGKWLPRK